MRKIIEDGIIDTEIFKKEPIKILFILKEAYDKDTKGNFTKDGGWNLPELIKKMIKEFRLTQIPTFNGLFLFSAQYFQNSNLEVMQKIAYINVIKESGESETKGKKLETEFERNKTLLLSQIQEIEPDIIIFAGNGIADLFMKEWGISEGDKKRDTEDTSHYFRYKDYLCINTYHPSHERNSTQSFSKVCIPEI